jgi:AcrR family transcriptional regulator
VSRRASQGPSAERVLAVAEAHFVARGFQSVTLKDVADDLGIKQASLYYHVPGGKEDLYVEVMLRCLERHQTALSAVGAGEPVDLTSRLVRMATWAISQPPMNIARVMVSDLPALAPRHRRLVEDAIVRCLLAPVEEVLRDAAARGVVLRHGVRASAGAFWAMVQSIPGVSLTRDAPPAEALVAQSIDLLLHGMLGGAGDAPRRAPAPNKE